MDPVSTVKPDQGPVARPPPVTVVQCLLVDLVLLGPCQTSPCTSSILMAGGIKGSQTLVHLQDTILVRLTNVIRDINYSLNCNRITCPCSGSSNIKTQHKEFLLTFLLYSIGQNDFIERNCLLLNLVPLFLYTFYHIDYRQYSGKRARLVRTNSQRYAQSEC